MSEVFPEKDNEFIAWYPTCVSADQTEGVWAKKPAAYYVHIPFCTAICDYCGFAVSRLKDANIERYLYALQKEIRRYADSGRLANYRFVCGHFGGGTPSVLSADQLLSIKRLVTDAFEVDTGAEVTVEVNPISFTLQKAQAYHAEGVNRISFGAQSFQDRLLRLIGRPHHSGDVAATVDIIRKARFENYSIDIIYGIPSQTLDELQYDLDRAIDTGATHLSCFRLEIIPFTALKLREAAGQLPSRLSVQALNEMDDLVTETLEGAGYVEYGVFNYAKPDFESVHNRIAFVAPQGEYIGFGNSSYSYINGCVYCNYADVHEYEAAVWSGRDPIALAHRLDTHELMSRYFVLGIKFKRVSSYKFSALFGLTPKQVFGSQLEKLCTSGMIEATDDGYRLTRRGRHYVNNVCKEFYVGESRGRRQHAQFVPTLTPLQVSHYARLLRRESENSRPAPKSETE